MVADGILVAQLAFEHHRDDLHVAMAVHVEAPPRRNAVVIDHTQGPEAHPGGVEMVGKTEAVPAVEPAVLAVEAFSGRPPHQIGMTSEAAGGRGARKQSTHGLVARARRD